MIDYHTRLDAQSAVLYYKGPFDKDILANISLQLRRRFAENPRMSAKLFSIFIELAQNIAYYSEESNFFYDEEGKKDVRYSDETRKNNGVGTVVIHNEDTEVILSAGNLVPTEKVKEIIPEIPCHIIALERLEKLREQKLWQSGKLKMYHSEISEILRDYIEKRYNVNALEETTDEIMYGLRLHAIPNDVKEKLFQILTLADLVKFAKEQPLANENDMSLIYSIEFINQTKLVIPNSPQKNV